MRDPEAAVLASVVECVRAMPARVANELVAQLRELPEWSKASGVVTPPSCAQAFAQLCREARKSPSSTPARVADLLALAATVEEGWPGRTDCEVAWTGPTPKMSTLRRTEQALLTVLEEARAEVWLVSFAAYRVQSVLDALTAAADRGCRVKILLESTVESDGKLRSGGITALPDEIVRRCDVHVWPRDKRPQDERGNSGTLHAKCAVADEQLLFVGSANLTEHAFEINIELGLLVRGGPAPREVQRHLQWLDQTQSIERVN